MTNSPVVVATDDHAAAALCPACGHLLSAHDRIGVRWCGATTATGATRDCMCADVVRVVRDLSYYGGITPNRRTSTGK
ncbi:MAG: RGCVC family protein [Propionibacteriaceae bacterium]